MQRRHAVGFVIAAALTGAAWSTVAADRSQAGEDTRFDLRLIAVDKGRQVAFVRNQDTADSCVWIGETEDGPGAVTCGAEAFDLYAAEADAADLPLTVSSPESPLIGFSLFGFSLSVDADDEPDGDTAVIRMKADGAEYTITAFDGDDAAGENGPDRAVIRIDDATAEHALDFIQDQDGADQDQRRAMAEGVGLKPRA